MPTRVQLPNGQTADFPDGMQPADIQKAIESDPTFGVKQQSIPEDNPPQIQTPKPELKYVPTLDSPKNLLTGAWEGAKNLLAHPLQAAAGIGQSVAATGLSPNGYPTTAATGRDADTYNNQLVQGAAQGDQRDAANYMGAHPLKTVGNIAGQALVTAGAAKVLPRLAAPALETIGEGLQRRGEGVINKGVLGVRKADVKRGANPGAGYFQGGNGPSMSMRSIADKASASLNQTGEAIGAALDNGVGNGVTIPGSEVADTVNAPANAARATLNGPFGAGSADLDARMARFNGAIKPEMTPRDVFSLKKNVADNVSWSDPTAVGTKQVGQQIAGGLSGLNSKYVPELEPLNSQFQNQLSLEKVANDRATTGQQPLTQLARKAGAGLTGAALGYAHSPVAAAGVAGLGLLADSVPVKTSLASAMYYTGKGAVAVGNGIRGLYSSPAATVPASFAFDRKPLQLESSTPTNAGFGASPDSGSFPARSPITPPAPRSPLALPASTSAGQAQPMIGVKAPAQYPALAEDFARNRTTPTQFTKPPQILPRSAPIGTTRGYLMPPKKGKASVLPNSGQR